MSDEVIGTDNTAAARIFISYAREDAALKDEIEKFLQPYAASQRIEAWSDERIGPGDQWEEAIEQALATCDLALLLVSIDFLNSKFIQEREIPTLLKRQEEEGISIVVVLLAPCPWDLHEAHKLQALPKSLKPLSEHVGPHDRPAVLTEIAKAVARLAAETAKARVATPVDAGRVATAGEPALDPRKLDKALRLDREVAWRELLDAVSVEPARNTLFIVHGERRQNLELFVARVTIFLEEESNKRGSHRAYEVRPVPTELQQQLPTTHTAWIRHLGSAYERLQGSAEERVAEAARHAAQLVVIGDGPLGATELGGSPQAVGALEKFLTGPLLDLLKPRHSHPVHAMVALPNEIEGEHDALFGAIDQGARDRGIVFKELPLPDVAWADVNQFIATLDEIPFMQRQRYRKQLEPLVRALEKEQGSFLAVAMLLQRCLSGESLEPVTEPKGS